MSTPPAGRKIIAVNRKARHYYEFLEFVEAGLALTGSEVKSLRDGGVNFKDGHVRFRNHEAWLVGVHIAPYAHAALVEHGGHEPERERKLLLHAREIKALMAKVEQKGLTIVPTQMYFKAGKAKVELAVARGKKFHDRRDDLKRDAEDRDAARDLSSRR